MLFCRVLKLLYCFWFGENILSCLPCFFFPSGINLPHQEKGTIVFGSLKLKVLRMLPIMLNVSVK